jgi:uncharacterized glyoxalase superfamily protein PhnB
LAELAKNTRCTMIATLRYRDANAGIEFLCNAFGFERHLVVPGANDSIAHAQLTFGDGMIMLGSHPHEGEFGRWVQPPRAPDRINTHSLYVIVTDADAHYARAKQARADILRPPTDQDYGGRDYSARDPDGYIWTFGHLRSLDVTPA